MKIQNGESLKGQVGTNIAYSEARQDKTKKKETEPEWDSKRDRK